jgi:hypothetical protein
MGSSPIARSCGPVAQLEERLSYKEDVVGISFGDARRTSPTGITKYGSVA